MYFGIEEENLEKNVEKEIYKESQSLVKAHDIVSGQSDIIKKFLHKNLKENTKIILTGADTTDSFRDMIYEKVSKELHFRVEAISTNDLVAHPELYLEEDTPTILMSFEGSDNSMESVAAYDLGNKFVKNIKQLVITCNGMGELAKKAFIDIRSFCLLMPQETNGKKFEMTRALSSMMSSEILCLI